MFPFQVPVGWLVNVNVDSFWIAAVGLSCAIAFTTVGLFFLAAAGLGERTSSDRAFARIGLGFLLAALPAYFLHIYVLAPAGVVLCGMLLYGAARGVKRAFSRE